MMKALAETIIPAIDATNRAAVEQARILVGSLELLRRQIEDAFAAPDTGGGRRVQALVLTHGEAQIGRERAFVATAGFDVSPDNLPSIDEAISSAVEPSGATSR